MVKKLISIIAIAAMVFVNTSVYAVDDIVVIIDNNRIEFDVPPQIIDERTMVPVRRIFETYGAKVDWVEGSQMIFAYIGTEIIAMQIDAYTINVTNVVTGETRAVEIDVPPQIVDERTLVPIRAISETLNKTVIWNGDTREVVITSK